MKDEFLSTLENSWELITIAPGGQKYCVRAFTNNEIIEAIVTLVCPGTEVVEGQFVALGDPDYFTDGVIYSIFKDLSTMVCHYVPECKILYCDTTFGNRTKKFGWYLKDIVKTGGLK